MAKGIPWTRTRASRSAGHSASTSTLKDLRTAGGNVGVLSAFADVVYDTTRIDVTGIVWLFNDFSTGQLDDLVGKVDEVGGLKNARPANRDPQAVFYLQAQAVATGTLTVSMAAGQSLFSENQLFGVDGDLQNQTRYGSGQLTLEAPGKPWHNVVQACDVNGDGYVAPLDVLSVINDLNLHGTRNLPAEVPVGESPGFVDVNDDGMAAPIDVLVIIEYINSHAVGEGEATGFTQDTGGVWPPAVPYPTPLTVSATDNFRPAQSPQVQGIVATVPAKVEGQLTCMLILTDGPPTSAAADSQNNRRHFVTPVGVPRTQEDTMLDDLVSSPRFGDLEELLDLLANDVAGTGARI